MWLLRKATWKRAECWSRRGPTSTPDHEGLTPLDRAKRFARFAHSGGVVELLQQATAVEEVDAGSAKQPKKTPKKKPDKDS
mmetsp:Transcript_66087/g.144330  ORF Transcript_66087/g.144330 Transcript_66087/m.144330 type:complete len:81 (-) Transcript_66087:48-290(-)